MSNPSFPASTDTTASVPAVRTIGIEDLKDALQRGWDDFRAMPTHAVFISLIYPVLGLLLARAVLGYDVVPLLYPLAAGFALIGPIAAIGLYEMSRRRECGLDTDWSHAFDVLRSHSVGAITALGIMLLVIFVLWLWVANAIFIALFGYGSPASLTGFLHEVFSTPAGHKLIIVGNAVGFLFAVVALTLSVVSFPMLLDRPVSATAAAATSVKAVMKNPVTMAIWGLIVAALLVVGSVPFLIGLAVVMPVLGHATWHLYRKVVA